MELYIIAGPNGAGKTTFAQEFLPNYADCKNFVNADLIAQGMAPFSPETAALRAGRTMLWGNPVVCPEWRILCLRNYAFGAKLPASPAAIESPRLRNPSLLSVA